MSIKYVKNKSGRGGFREGAGRKPDSGESTKICVSVQKQNWNTAVKRWQRYRQQRKPSWLVDRLIEYYVKTNGSFLETEAAL